MRKLLALATLTATVGTFALTATSATAAQSTASNKKFCDVNWKISQIFTSVSDEPTDAQVEKIQGKVDSLLDSVQGSVPAEIEPQVTAASDIIRQGIQQAFENSQLQQYGEQIDAYAFDNCDYQAVDVSATEYKFSGIPKKLKPGRTIFKITNDGAEVHEIVLVGIKTKTPLKKLLADDKRAEKESEFKGATFVTQGNSGYAYALLKKGRHAALCFVPVGTTDPSTLDEQSHEHGGPPHAAKGMAQEFQVS